jgi:hypothetical protein
LLYPGTGREIHWRVLYGGRPCGGRRLFSSIELAIAGNREELNMTAMNLTPTHAASDLDQTLAALAVAVDRLKTARAAGTAEHGDTDEQLVTALARKAHRLDPEAVSTNLLLGTVGMRLIVPEVEHQLITTLLSDVRRDIRGDYPGAALETLAKAQEHVDTLAHYAGVKL